MQHFGYLLGAIAAFVAIFLVASPERFFKHQSKSKKLVGASYWGTYDNADDKDAESKDRSKNTSKSNEYGYIESVVYASKEHSIAGSETYARGWGVKE